MQARQTQQGRWVTVAELEGRRVSLRAGSKYRSKPRNERQIESFETLECTHFGTRQVCLCAVRPRQTLQNGTQASDSGQMLKAPDACIRSPRHFSSLTDTDLLLRAVWLASPPRAP